MPRRSISVVIASGAGGEFLFRCLDSLAAQAEAEAAEVIVPDRVGGETAARVARDFPWARLLPVALGHRPSIPELRREGAKASQGEIVAVIEEHCTAPADWLAGIRAEFSDGDAALGGPILDDGYERLRDWVVYLSEYNNYLPPWADGPRVALNGANIAYDRARLLKHEDVLGEGYWEVVLHPRLAPEGRLRAVSTLGVRHTGPFDFGYYLEQRYLLSRVWGGTQRRLVSPVKRLVYLLVAPLLPFLLLARIGVRVLRSDVSICRFLVCVPLLLPVCVAYVWGEWLGYLVGTGDALERVE